VPSPDRFNYLSMLPPMSSLPPPSSMEKKGHMWVKWLVVRGRDNGGREEKQNEKMCGNHVASPTCFGSWYRV
jgi:hypothetical protein